ncbi:hypothetical protein ABDD95_18425 [Mucilaginibacter sp. PAMB04274]|uniref:hypothetical protein n=1 Tax=Mucilaginibacter sp. PAMB04274 TaxID=3138568 RepID=UPI0031F6188D
MDNLNDLKAIWHTAKTESLPTSKEMMQLVGKFRGQKLKRKWLVIVIAAFIGCLMLAVLVVTPFKLFTTYFGGALIIAGSVLLAATEIRSLKRFNKLNDCSNLEFLAFIEKTRQNQIFYYKKTMVVIVLLCSVGWVLYMYEPVQKYPFWRVGIYTVMAIYLAVMWFVVRPRALKKDGEKLNAIKQRLESITKQLQ